MSLSNPLLIKPILTLGIAFLFFMLIAAVWHLAKILAGKLFARIGANKNKALSAGVLPAAWRRFSRGCSWTLVILTIAVVTWSFFRVGMEALGGYRQGRSVITLRILHWGSPSEDRIVRRLIQNFEAHHPHVRVQDINDSGDYPAKLKTMFAAGAPPDLFYMPGSSFLRLARDGLLLNLTPLIARQRAKGHFLWLGDMYPALRKAYEFNGRTVGSGNLYGLPKDCSSMVFYVNINLFHRAHLPIPWHGWTWHTFHQDARIISKLPADSNGPFYGAVINTAPLEFQNIIWSFGGHFFYHANCRRPALDSPAAQAAMNLVYTMRFKDHSAFNATGIAHHGSEEFYRGQVGAIGPQGRWTTVPYRYIRNFKWDVVPVPHGARNISSITTVAWSIAAATHHPRHSVELLRFLCGPRGQSIQAKLGLSIPSLESVAHSTAFLVPGQIPAHSQLFLTALAHGRLPRAFAHHAEFRSILQQEITAALRLGIKSPLAAAHAITRRWKALRDASRNQSDHPPMPWRFLAIVTTMALALPLIWWLWRILRTDAKYARNRIGVLFISPWLIGFCALTAGPMTLSLYLSLTHWTAIQPLADARFTGLRNYHDILLADHNVFHALWLTLLYVVLLIPLGQGLGLALAILVNTRTAGIRFFRTAFFLPSVVSGVAMATLWLGMFNADYGLVNAVLAPVLNLPSSLLGFLAGLPGLQQPFASWSAAVHVAPPDWFGLDARHWAVPGFVLMGLWGIGSAMIIYLAGLKAIPESFHESARVDGAGAFRRFWHITLPMLSPLVFFNVVMAMIGSFQIFTQVQVMTNGGPDKATNFYVLYLYHQAFEYYHMGYASALAWLLFALLLTLTLLLFRVSRRWIYYEAFRE